MAIPERQALFDVTAVVKEAWDLYTKQVVAWLLIGALFFVVYVVAAFTCIGGLLIYGPISAGMHIAAFKQLRGQAPEVGDLFAGFNWFGTTCVAGIVYLLCASLGFILCIVPGIFVMLWWMFAIPLCVSHNLGAMESLARSKEMVSRSLSEFFVLGLVHFLIHTLSGFVPFGQILIAYPLSALITAILIRDLYGLDGALPRAAAPAPVPAPPSAVCPACRAAVTPGTRFCTACGAPIA